MDTIDRETTRRRLTNLQWSLEAARRSLCDAADHAELLGQVDVQKTLGQLASAITDEHKRALVAVRASYEETESGHA